MAFSTQLAATYDITKLVPITPIVSVASRGLLELVRDFQSSGSDLVTEHDLAEVFGRNFITPRFASTFKTAVRKSAIHRLAGIAEIVLEAGAGPTVRNAVEKAAFFPMLVQLSALLWAHNVASLASALKEAFERRNLGTLKTTLSYNHLVGTLRSIQQQTSGFMWELYFTAVDEILRSQLDIHVSEIGRAIPHPVFEVLVDALPAIQHFPSKHFLSIKARVGITALVVWIHHVLGLTVEIQSEHNVVKLGNDSASVSIDCRSTGEAQLPEVSLLNEAKDVTFRAAVDPQVEPILESTSRHSLEGYGLRYIRNLLDDQSAAEEIVLRFMRDCLREREKAMPGGMNHYYLPSKERMLTAGRILFSFENISQSRLDQLEDVKAPPSVPGESSHSEWTSTQLGAPINNQAKISSKAAKALNHLLFAISMISNLEECRWVPLNLSGLRKRAVYSNTGPMAVRTAFDTLACLLLEQPPEQHQLDQAAVISAWGWSLCISCILHKDPGDLRPDLTIKQGVPSRNKERKEWIMDHTAGIMWVNDLGDATGYEIVARTGDPFHVESFLKHSSTSYLIGSTEPAFLVYTKLTCYDDPKIAAYFRLGFRYMQDLYWYTYRVPHCEHNPSMYSREVPSGCVVVTGLMEGAVSTSLATAASTAIAPSTDSASCTIHISMSAGNISVRWILLAQIRSYMRETDEKVFDACYLRNRDCCLDCAIKYIRERHQDLYSMVALIA